jgi:hypothetical protein
MKHLVLLCAVFTLMNSCKNISKSTTAISDKNTTTYPSDVMPVLSDFKIMLGDGSKIENLKNLEHKDYFYSENDGEDWVVYKTPNQGVTSKNSKNTRTELHEKHMWTPETGRKLSAKLKVQHVSKTGDARVAASYAVVVGQIHSGEGHENEPIKIFYKKFPGHKKGSVYWNYEINTAGDNSERWDYSSAIWGYDMSVTGTDAAVYPPEPEDGIELNEEFDYEINVYKGIMYLTFTSANHETKTFVKSLISSDFSVRSKIPQQILTLYAETGQDGVEQEKAYSGELQYFKQGAYNQSNGKKPTSNIVWSTGSETFEGDVVKQYANGDYAEVWFKKATLGPGTPPNIE